jgi:hypothetical protein
MKKFILMAGTALLLAGCDKGGSNDQYGTGTGTDRKGSQTSPGNAGTGSQGSQGTGMTTNNSTSNP